MKPCRTAEFPPSIRQYKRHQRQSLELRRDLTQQVQELTRQFWQHCRLHELGPVAHHLRADREAAANLEFSKIDILKVDEYGSYIDPDPYAGYTFKNTCRENNITGDVKECLKVRCFAFLCKLLKELKSRLSSNLSIFSKINILAVSECIKKIKPSITELAEGYYRNDPDCITKIEFQWANLSNINWMNTNNTMDFWSKVFHYSDASRENPFKEMVILSSKLLTLPFSNADVERLFSQMNVVKTKVRNRISLQTLSNILTIKYGLRIEGKCCNSNNYIITKDMLNQIENMKSYISKEVDYSDLNVDDGTDESLFD